MYIMYIMYIMLHYVRYNIMLYNTLNTEKSAMYWIRETWTAI